MITTFLKSKDILSHIKYLTNMGYESYSGLLPIQKEKICSLILKELGTDAFNILVDIDDPSNLTKTFLNYLTSDSKNDAVDFSEIIKKNLISRYEEELNEIFNELNWRKAS